MYYLKIIAIPFQVTLCFLVHQHLLACAEATTGAVNNEVGVHGGHCQGNKWSEVVDESEEEISGGRFIVYRVPVVTWPDVNIDNPSPVALEDLPGVRLENREYDSNTLTFNKNLIVLVLYDATLKNGTLFDILRPATNLEILKFFDASEINVGTPRSQSYTRFLTKLEALTIWGTELLNGTLYGLLKYAANLESLDIWKMSKVDIISTTDEEVPSTFLGELASLEIKETNAMTGSLYNFLKSANNLRKIDIREAGEIDFSTLTPRAHKFLGQLVSFNMENTKCSNGNLNEFLMTANNLEFLNIEDYGMGEIDISKLPPANLNNLKIRSAKLKSSTLVKFNNLLEIELTDCESSERRIFEDFDVYYPNVTSLRSGSKLIINPKAFISILKSSVTTFEFSFDFDPPIKTYEFGVALKLMMDAGYSHGLQWSESDAPPEDLPVKQRVHYILFEKQSYNGTQSWMCSKDYTSYGQFAIVEDIKPLESKAIIYFYFGLLSVIIFIGSVGNVLSGIVLLKKKVKSSSVIVLLGLTLFDFLVILTYFLSSFFNAKLFYSMFIRAGEKSEVYTVDVHLWMSEQNRIQAFLIYPLNKTAYTGSVYTTVLISMERFVAICWPLRSKYLLSSKNSKLAILIILTFSVVINIPRWIESYEWNFYTETSPHWNDYYRPTFMRMDRYKIIYHGWTWALFMYVLPFVLLGYFNYKIIRQIKSSRNFRESLEVSTSDTSRRKAEEVAETLSVTKMLLCVVIVFVVCNSLHIAIVSYFLLSYKHIEPSTIEAVSCLPIIINSSVNFIIYIVLGKTLRSEFLNLLPKWLRANVEPEPTDSGGTELSALS